MLCVGSSLAVYPVAGLPRLTLERGGRLAIVTKGPTPYDGEAELKLDGEVDEELTRAARRARLAASSRGSGRRSLLAGSGDDRPRPRGRRSVALRAQMSPRFRAAAVDRFGAVTPGDVGVRCSRGGGRRLAVAGGREDKRERSRRPSTSDRDDRDVALALGQPGAAAC